MSVERYAQWCERNGERVIQHTNWLELPDRALAVVVTLTPPMSKNATNGALGRVTDPTLPVLVETFNVPNGEIYASRDDGWTFLGLRVWVRGAGMRLQLREPVRPV